MPPLTKQVVLELLKKGAIIEYVSWGINPNIYIRLDKEDIFERVNRATFFALRDHDKILKQIRQKELTQFWVLSVVSK